LVNHQPTLDIGSTVMTCDFVRRKDHARGRVGGSGRNVVARCRRGALEGLVEQRADRVAGGAHRVFAAYVSPRKVAWIPRTVTGPRPPVCASTQELLDCTPSACLAA
jgi:hypothetical protein